MDFQYTQDQILFREEIIDFSKRYLNGKEELQYFSREQWKNISEFGFHGLKTATEYGGLNESYLTAAIATEALGYACENNGFVFAVTNHIWVALHLISLFGTKNIKERYLPLMVSGEKIGAFALTEAESGSDALSMRTEATKDGDFYILRGNKMFISNGTIADIFIVIALTDAETKKYTAFLVSRDLDGVKTGPEIEKMGLDACPMSELQLNDCRVPKENVLGHINMGASIMATALELERCYEFAPHVGAMQRIMEKCIEYSKERTQFGKPIKQFQAISHRISDMKVAIELSKNMLYKVAWLKDQGKIAFLEAAIFKLFVSEHYIKTCQSALQIFGAYGYTKEFSIERELRDACACSIYSGTSEVQRNTIFDFISMA